MKIILTLIIASSLIAQNQPVYNPYPQALGLPQPVIVQPMPQNINPNLNELYIRSIIIQQNAQAQINQDLANQANPSYVPKDYIGTQQIIDALLNAK